MTKVFTILALLVLLVTPMNSYAFGVEFAAGGWNQSPQGDLSYKEITGDDTLNLENDLNYDDRLRPFGRIKLNMPFLLPNIYVMATPVEFEETGRKNVNFSFGGETFSGNVDFDSKLKLNHLDVGLFYGISPLRKVTGGMLNIDVGINIRVVDFEARLEQPSTGLKSSESHILPIPMIYLGAQLKPHAKFALEFEGRGITYSDNYYYSLTGRLKLKPFHPLFVAGGYRYDKVDIDYSDVVVQANFHGPFAEVGIEF